MIVCPYVDPADLFEVVKGGQDDVMTSSHQTHGSQQLQHQSFGPAKESRFHTFRTHAEHLHTFTHTHTHKCLHRHAGYLGFLLLRLRVISLTQQG